MTVLAEPTTGEIPRVAGEGHTELVRPRPELEPQPVKVPEGPTTRLVPPPRRPDADDTGDILYRRGLDVPATVGDVDARSGCRTVVPNDEDFTTSPTVPPKPLPEPPTTPKPANDHGDAQPIGYAGRHRAADTAPVAEIHPAVIQPAPATLAVEETGRLWPNIPARLIDWVRALLGLGGGAS